MAGPSRIDELRKKFDENPRRYFAPLANEYRKMGDFDQAIFICQEFLPQQPGHMSGHIVYGQALFEAGRHDEARTVFETALALDPENLIALRHLGDIARAHGDSETARAWYRRVLESDPRNEEIAGILSSLDADESPAGGAARQPETSPSEVSDGRLDLQSAMTSAAPDVQSAPASDPVVDEPLTSAPSESTFDELAKLFTSSAPASEPAAAPTAAPTGTGDDSLGLIHEGEDVLGRAAEMHGAEKPSAIDGIAHGGQEAGAAESPTFTAPFLDALGAAEAAAPRAGAESARSEFAPVTSPAAPVRREERPVATEAPPDPGAAFVTETMAELYLRQGHRELAVDVYRKLVALRPDDVTLRARLHELERPAAPTREAAPAPAVAADAGPTIREFLLSIAEFRPASGHNGAGSGAPAHLPAVIADRSPPRPDQQATVGTSLHALLADELEQKPRETSAQAAAQTTPADLPFLDAAKPPDATPMSGRPATPAATELSLDHVFRHATPAASTGAQPSSFSFDQFFSQQAHQDVSPGEAESSNEGSSGPSDDIQQFNAWLEGLKKT